MKRFVLFLILPVFLTGCAGHRLQPGGAYSAGSFTTILDANGVTSTVFTATSAPDFAFFAVDSSYDLAYSTLDGVFKFERENRAILWKVSPNIKHALDEIRIQAIAVNSQYLRARETYKANPIPANLGVLQETLARVQALAATAQTAAIPAPKGN